MVAHRADRGRVRTDNDTDPGTVASDATDYLTEAGEAAHDVARLLSGAQQHLAHLGATELPQATGRRFRREQDLADIAAGLKTGWWDDNGRPAPWPDDSFADDSDWSTASSDNLPTTSAQRPKAMPPASRTRRPIDGRAAFGPSRDGEGARSFCRHGREGRVHRRSHGAR